MKRATRRFAFSNTGPTPDGQKFLDILDSEKRLKAEVRRLRRIAKFATHSDGCLGPLLGVDACRCGYFAALRPAKRR